MMIKVAMTLVAGFVVIVIFRIFGISDRYHLVPLAAFLIIWGFPNKFSNRIRKKKAGALAWQNRRLEIKARLIPKFLWTTASIDVYLDDSCILKTGGQLATRGKQVSEFEFNNQDHLAELSWTPPSGGIFYPYQLVIDQQLVDNSDVYIRNWPMGLFGVAIICGIVFGIPLLVFHAHR